MVDYKFTWRGKQVKSQVTYYGLQGMEKACIMMTDHIKSSFYHGAPSSPPGSPPAVRSATLKRSITHKVRAMGNVIIGAVGTAIGKGAPKGGKAQPYGLYLEYGTFKMKPKPFLRPALKAKQKEALRIITKFLKKVK